MSSKIINKKVLVMKCNCCDEYYPICDLSVREKVCIDCYGNMLSYIPKKKKLVMECSECNQRKPVDMFCVSLTEDYICEDCWGKPYICDAYKCNNKKGLKWGEAYCSVNREITTQMFCPYCYEEYTSQLSDNEDDEDC